jgi:hypothetical protein
MPYDRYDSTDKFTMRYSSAMIRSPLQYKDIFRLCCDLFFVVIEKLWMVSAVTTERVQVTAVFEL